MGRIPNNANTWPEEHINGYLSLLGCLRMAERGSGVLVVTWTTVVLLGGFVSALNSKDFWCLTLITFIQVSWVVDALSIKKLESLEYAVLGWEAYRMVLSRDQAKRAAAYARGSGCTIRAAAFAKQLLAVVAWFVQIVALVVLAVAAVGIIGFAQYITAGVSLWRLIQHDYGNAVGGNLIWGLDVLYILAVLQAAISFYRDKIKRYASYKIVDGVAKKYGFKKREKWVVYNYFSQTIDKCFMDPSSVQGMNLVRFAVDLMGPDKSPDDFCRGLMIFNRLLGPLRSDKLTEQRRLIKQLIASPSNGHILEKLLHILNPRSNPYDRELVIQIHNEIGRHDRELFIEIQNNDREIRQRAARIVVHVADKARPEQLPQVIQCISSMIDTFGEYRHRAFFSDITDDENDSREEEEEEGYKELLANGLHMLYALAADENSCRVIGDTRGLLTKIMAPLTSDLIHLTDHDRSWERIIEESLILMRRLGVKLHREMSINNEAICGMERIVECNQCKAELQKLAMGILAKLHMDSEISKGRFIKMMLDIFTDNNDSSITRFAVESLAKLCSQDRSNATIIFQVNAAAVDRLTSELAALDNGYQSHMISAAEILEHLCIHYTKDDEYLRKLKKAMIDLMPKVLNKILPGDIVDQQGSASQDNSPNRSSSSPLESQEQPDNRETEAALLSLCVTVCNTFISQDQHLALQFDAVSLPCKLRGMVERNSDPTVSCLKILKLTSKMVISMMKRTGSRYLKQDLKRLVEAMSRACSRNMTLLDSSMVFASSDDDGAMRRTLKSLVDEASQLVQSYKPQEE